jgi:hypothetical protein
MSGRRSRARVRKGMYLILVTTLTFLQGEET